MDIFIREIQTHMFSFWEFLPLLLYAFVAFIFFLLLGYAVAGGVKRALQIRNFSSTYESFFLKIIRWVFGIIGFLISLKIIGFTGVATSILAGGGVTAIILGFAFRDIGENILAGFFLAFSRPFKLSDLIRSEDLEGRVQNVDLRHTHIRTAEGCDIFIPNAQILTKPLHNFTRDGFRRTDFTIGIDYADDIPKAIKLINQKLQHVNELLSDPPPEAIISGFNPSYVELNIAFWINTHKQELMLNSIRTEAMEICRKTLLQEGFTFSSSVTTAVDMEKINVSIERQ